MPNLLMMDAMTKKTSLKKKNDIIYIDVCTSNSLNRFQSLSLSLSLYIYIYIYIVELTGVTAEKDSDHLGTVHIRVFYLTHGSGIMLSNTNVIYNIIMVWCIVWNIVW